MGCLGFRHIVNVTAVLERMILKDRKFETRLVLLKLGCKEFIKIKKRQQSVKKILESLFHITYWQALKWHSDKDTET